MAQSRNLLILWRTRPIPCASYQWLSARRSSPLTMRTVALANRPPDGDGLDVGDRPDDLEVYVASSLDRSRRTTTMSGAHQRVRSIAELGAPSLSAACMTEVRKAMSLRDSHQQPRTKATPASKKPMP